MKLKTILAGVTALICSSSAFAAEKVVSFPSIAAQDGYVSSYYTANTVGTEVKIGKSGFVTYKGIMTFDTSSLPADAVITTVAIGAPGGIEEGTFDTSSGNIYRYLEDNIVVDFGGLNGLGGSFAVTASDYYAYTSQSTSFYFNAANGFMMIENAESFINTYGKTQVRFSFTSNPSSVVLNLDSAENTANPDLPALYIVYSSASEQ